MNEEIRSHDWNRSKNRQRYENKTDLSCGKNEYDTFTKNPKIYTSQIQDASDRNARQRKRPRTDTNLKVTNIEDISSKEPKGIDLKQGQQRKQYKQSQKRVRHNVSVHQINNFKSSSATYTDKVIRKARKNRRKLPANDSAAELPIRDILNKSKETRYLSENSTPLRELTTDTLYIQRRDADFSAVKISRRNTFDDPCVSAARIHSSNPIDVSVMAQKFWKCASLIYQGLLGGLGLMHFILMQTFFERNFEFIKTYSNVSEIYTNVFSFLTVMCLVSSLDRYDVAHLDGKRMQEIYLGPSKSAIAIPIYLTMLCLHQITFEMDEKFSLIYYNTTMWTDSNGQHIFLEELGSWQGLTMTKDILAVIAWIFTCIATRTDLLLIHLETMQKYANAPRTT